MRLIWAQAVFMEKCRIISGPMYVGVNKTRNPQAHYRDMEEKNAKGQGRNLNCSLKYFAQNQF